MTAGRSDALLFAAFARAADWHLGTLNLQDLINTAWAFATAGRSDELLFVVLAEAAGQCMGEFNA